MRSRSRFLLLQLADGTFPSGGFAHSAGLEAASVLGGIGAAPGDLETFLDASLRQVGRATLPFVRAASRDPSFLARLDDEFDTTLPLAAPNQASRTQGRALVAAAARIWDELAEIGTYARIGPAHHAPVFGAVFGVLGVSTEDTAVAYLHGAARTILSAGVRLGLVGALESQRLMAERAPLFEALEHDAREVEPSAAAQTAPLFELFAGLHDRLDGRMFQS